MIWMIGFALLTGCGQVAGGKKDPTALVIGDDAGKGDKGDPGVSCHGESVEGGVRVVCGTEEFLVPKGDKGDKGDKGEDGLDGQNGQDGVVSSVAFFDAASKKIGYYVGLSAPGARRFEIMTVDGARTFVNVDTADISSPDINSGIDCYYETTDCSGACFTIVHQNRGYLLRGASTSVHYVPFSGPEISVHYKSYYDLNADRCDLWDDTWPGYATVPYSGIMTETLSTPLSFEPAG